jgi:hypothetical protein
MYEKLRDGIIDFVVILGGKRAIGPSEAEAYYEYAKRHLPTLAARIVLVNAEGVFTNEDIVLAMPQIDDYLRKAGGNRKDAKLWVPTYKKHYRRTAVLIDWLGFCGSEWLDSHEKQGFPDWAEDLMYLVSRIDPPWRTIFARPFVWKARKRYQEVIR